jgi:hypothetical protein
MKVLAAVLIVTALWMLMARLLEGCGGLHGAPATRSTAVVADAWMWEQHERVVSLSHHVELPSGHPLERLAAAERSGGAWRNA